MTPGRPVAKREHQCAEPQERGADRPRHAGRAHRADPARQGGRCPGTARQKCGARADQPADQEAGRGRCDELRDQHRHADHRDHRHRRQPPQSSTGTGQRPARGQPPDGQNRAAAGRDQLLHDSRKNRDRSSARSACCSLGFVALVVWAGWTMMVVWPAGGSRLRSARRDPRARPQHLPVPRPRHAAMIPDTYEEWFLASVVMLWAYWLLMTIFRAWRKR